MEAMPESRILAALAFAVTLATGLLWYRRMLAREKPVEGEPQTLEKFRAMAKKAGMDLPVQDLDELAQHLLGDIRAERFVSMIGREHAGATLEQRAKRIGAGELPQAPSRGMMI